MGVPACLLILKKGRNKERKGKTLLVYAARHYRELSNQNQLRPQDVMRILVHYHAYGDAARAAQLVEQHAGRLQDVVTRAEAVEIARLQAEYEPFAENVRKLEAEIAALDEQVQASLLKSDAKLEKAKTRLEKTLERPRKKLAERANGPPKTARPSTRRARNCAASTKTRRN
jgi:type I restriction enzyme M protein